ncbi:adenosylhomocysteinase [Candidatus Bipolaricaulota bacterium]|jgi:adenosylhomocysteinase|nr:adenosylhomocysteinase [Candidatus Bipolaricaulota bacterium]TFH11074.1 MAG: adenosylhomocysteinase [Candidatus Atribacteria bacterium]
MSIHLEKGRNRIDWANSRMPLLNLLRKRFLRDTPFAGKRISMSIHLEAKTACLAILLRDAGAQVHVTGSNPLSTQDDIAAALAQEANISVFARHGVSSDEYTDHLTQTLAHEPHMILDDGGDLMTLLHQSPQAQVIGGCEETTTGVGRLRILAKEGKLLFPMFAVNDARMKSLFDNRYGTGQSVWDGIFRSTNLLIAGKSVLVVGYGWCGRGIAMRANGLGARVTVADVDPVRALEAWMEGLNVATVAEALRSADLVITATGCADVVPEEALQNAKDGVVLCNAGHFNVEVRPDTLAKMATSQRTVRDGVEEYTMPDGRRLFLLGEGRLVNLVLGDGHPVEIMDLSFAVQAMTLEHLLQESPLEPDLYSVPASIDERIARMKLDTLGVKIDTLTAEQTAYLGYDFS